MTSLRGTIEDSDSELVDDESQPASESPSLVHTLSPETLLTLDGDTHGYSLDMLNALASNAAPLFQIYRERIDTVFKLLHWPRILEMIQTRRQSLSPNISETLTLELAIIFAAICTLTDDDCLQITGRSKQQSIGTYRVAVQVALNGLELAKSPTVVKLQALALYLVGIAKLPAIDCSDTLPGGPTRL